ncbi:MAG: tRNA preQ1(34) S-adenosylmethionine ribosyltransferase-isomerase QueA [Candidatus Alkaliphilus sp. MAG34]|nr:tRNA preQ1(34) S-adenosylmethionine ribosyltransferase-isomerase QueA [Clostridiales bacterium]
METRDFNFYLPDKSIAQTPLENRDDSRLLVLNKETGETEHSYFYNIINFLNPGDCLVLNDTRVLPARLIGEKEDTKGKIEFLLLKRKDLDTWEALARPGKRAKPGSRFIFGNGLLYAQVINISDEGSRIIKFEYAGIFEEILDKLGQMPLPPYIKEKLEERERYQTVYSKNQGSAAAPTAGLHFTKELLRKIEEKGVKIVYITLHIGLGTFRPVKVARIEEHRMHSEFYIVDKLAADTINNTKKQCNKIIAVGTTSCRTLESIADEDGKVKPGSGWTDIFIYPGYRFKIIDSLITNFHLPESTLIMLVSAFAGRERILDTYKMAAQKGYRFFSFGDAMLIE